MAVEATHDLIEAALAGREGARVDLLERLRPRLVLWAASRMSAALRAKVEPEDVAQEALAAIHTGLDGFEARHPGAFMGWVFTIAENRIRDLVDHFGADKRQPRPPLELSQTSPSSAAYREEQVHRLRDAIERLPQDYRDVIRLYRLQEMPYDEVATILERSPGATRILYCRALKRLRALLNDEDPRNTT